MYYILIIVLCQDFFFDNFFFFCFVGSVLRPVWFLLRPNDFMIFLWYIMLLGVSECNLFDWLVYFDWLIDWFWLTDWLIDLFINCFGISILDINLMLCYLVCVLVSGFSFLSPEWIRQGAQHKSSFWKWAAQGHFWASAESLQDSHDMRVLWCHWGCQFAFQYGQQTWCDWTSLSSLGRHWRNILVVYCNIS